MIELKRKVRNLIKVGVVRCLIISNEICDGPSALLLGRSLIVEFVSSFVISIRKLEYHSFWMWLIG